MRELLTSEAEWQAWHALLGAHPGAERALTLTASARCRSYLRAGVPEAALRAVDDTAAEWSQGAAPREVHGSAGRPSPWRRALPLAAAVLVGAGLALIGRGPDGSTRGGDAVDLGVIEVVDPAGAVVRTPVGHGERPRLEGPGPYDVAWRIDAPDRAGRLLAWWVPTGGSPEPIGASLRVRPTFTVDPSGPGTLVLAVARGDVDEAAVVGRVGDGTRATDEALGAVWIVGFDVRSEGP